MPRRSEMKARRSSALLTTHYSLLPTRRGSLFIDALLSVAIFGLVVASFSTGLTGGQTGTVRGGNRVRATYLAEEGLEALRSIRDRSGGFTTISARPLGQDDGVTLTGADWTIVENPTTIDGIFTRKVVFSAGPDSNTRKVTSTVTWTEYTGNQTLSYSAETYLTNWRTAQAAPTVDWSLACVKTFIPTGFEDYADIVVDGNYAYVTEASASALYIIDLTTTPPSVVVDPQVPLTLPGLGPHDIVKKGNYVYIANDGATRELLTVNVDLTVPANPQVVNQEDVLGTGYGKGLVIDGATNTLYLARVAAPDGPEYIEYDIGADPVNPAPKASRDAELGRSSYSIALLNPTAAPDDTHAYLGTDDATQELSVVNGSVTPPTVPAGSNVGDGTRGVSTAVLASGNAAYLGVTANFPRQLYAFNISTPGSPANNPLDSIDEYSTGGDVGKGEVRDIAISPSPAVAFLATNAQAGAVWYYFQAVNLATPLSIENQRMENLNMQPVMSSAGDGAKGIAFRAVDPIFVSDTVYIVGGPHLVVLKPGGC